MEMTKEKVYLDTTVPSVYYDTRTLERLAQEYMRNGVFPEKYASDANHVAIAVTKKLF